MKLKQIYNEVKLYIPIIPYTREDFNKILSEIKEKLGDRLEDLNNPEYEKKYPSHIYGPKKTYFQYGSIYRDYISFSFHINNITEEEKNIIKNIINKSATKHNFFKPGKDTKTNGWVSFNFYNNDDIPNIRIGIYATIISISGGNI